MRFRTAAAGLALFLAACTTAELYKAANRNRLAAVKPRLLKYSATQPAAEQQKVNDLLDSWQAEVTAQTAASAK